MSKKQDRKNIVKRIKTASVLYKKCLVGKRFMCVFDGRYIEVIFKAENFRHLTGVGTKLSARRFYDYSVHGKLEESQIFFGQDHPFSLCQRKIQHINDIANMAESECFMLEEIKTSTMTYKFGTTDLHFTLCLNKELNENGLEKSECYVVQSLRDEDCFSKCDSAYTVTHIFSRQNDQKKYTNLLYLDDSSSVEELSKEIKSLLSEEINL